MVLQQPLLYAAICCCVFVFTALVSATTIECPIDCSVDPDIGAQVNACLLGAEQCNPDVLIVGAFDFLSLLGTTNITATEPSEFLYQPTNELVQRVSCAGLVDNDTDVNGTIVYVCLESFICYVPPESILHVPLVGVCAMSTLAAPALAQVQYEGNGDTVFYADACMATDPWQVTWLVFSNLTFDGGATLQPFFCSRKQNSNFSFTDVQFIGYTGPTLIDAEWCAYASAFYFDTVLIANIAYRPLKLEGLFEARIADFSCHRCCSANNSRCLEVFMSPAAHGVLDIIRPSCYRVQDVLPQRCRYYLSGDDSYGGSRCNEGVVQVFDKQATAQFANCDMLPLTIFDVLTQQYVTIVEYDPECRVYIDAVLCNYIQVSPSGNFSAKIGFAGGDILFAYDNPLACATGGVITAIPGPFFVREFDPRWGDGFGVQPLPPLPLSPTTVDSSFENFGIRWTFPDPFTVVGTQTPHPAYDGVYVMMCKNGHSRAVTQTFHVDAVHVGQMQTLRFRARRHGGIDKFASRTMRWLMDGETVAVVQEPQFSSTLLTSTSYYVMTFNMQWNVTTPGMHTLVLQCDFTGGSGSMTLQVDDVHWQPVTSSLDASANDLRDKGFEHHALDWLERSSDPSEYTIVRRDIDITDYLGEDTPIPPPPAALCTPRTGTYVAQLGVKEQLHRIYQPYTFTQSGVFTFTSHVYRGNSMGNYAGLTLDVISWNNNTDTFTVLGSMPIDATTLPEEDEYTFTVVNAPINILTAPQTLYLGFQCDFTASPGGQASLCVDDVQMVAIGVVGIVPDPTGFSAQTISSAPRIANQTCDCSNFTTTPRDPIDLPCIYEIDEFTVCHEEMPYCCATHTLVVYDQHALTPTLFTYACDDLGNDSCVFLLDCELLADGSIVDCRQFKCLDRNMSVPLANQYSVDMAYLFSSGYCVEWTNDSLIASPPLTLDSQNRTVYSPALTSAGTAYVLDALPVYWFVNCADGDDDYCQIYTDCTLEYNSASPMASSVLRNCSRLNCTTPSGTPLSSASDFAACTPYANVTYDSLNNVTITTLVYDTLYFNDSALSVYGGGWVLRANGEAHRFELGEFVVFMLEYYVYANGDGVVPVFRPPLQVANRASGCGPQAEFMRTCPCVPANGVVPAGSVSVHGETDTFYTCTAGVASCACNEEAIDASNPDPEGSVGIHIRAAPDTLRRLRVLDWRVQQMMDGAWIEQTSHELVISNTIALPVYYDAQAVIREISRQDNEYCHGNSVYGHDFVLHGRDSPYVEYCDAQCPQPFPTTEQEADCVVDDRATNDLPSFGVTVFNEINAALDKNGCDKVMLKANAVSAYFEEALTFQSLNRGVLLYALPNEPAIVVGQHTIETRTDNITVRGIRFIHSADNQRPLFEIVKKDDAKLTYMTVANCVVDLSGTRKAGIFDTKLLSYLTVNYTELNDAEFFGLKVINVEEVVWTQNRVTECVGRCIQIRFRQRVVIDGTACVNCRGGADLRGAAIFQLIAQENSACDRASHAHTCLLRNVVQIVNTTQESEPDFNDVCFYLSRGQWRLGDIYDLVCRRAQNGMVLVNTRLLGSPDLVGMMMLNPRMRPSRNQLRRLPPLRTQGKDYVLRGTGSLTSDGGATFFEFVESVETDYDTAPYTLPIDPIVCVSNANWHTQSGYDSSLAVLPRTGVTRFHNVSDMMEWCHDRRMVPSMLCNPMIEKYAFMAYASTLNGSRFTVETIHVRNDSWLQGIDLPGSVCTIANEEEASLVGVGHRILTRRFNVTSIQFWMPERQHLEPLDMWSSGPLEYTDAELVRSEPLTTRLPNEVLFVDVHFEGHGVLPLQQTRVLNLLVGVELPPQFYKAKTNALPPPTEALFVFNDSLIRDFPAYNDEVSPDGANYIPGQYPYTDGVRVVFANRLNARTVALISNSEFRDLDRSGLEIRFAHKQYVLDSRFYNCSGRSRGNEQCVLLYGNDVSQLLVNSKRVNATAIFLATPSEMFFDNVTGLHTTDVLFRFDDRRAQPGLVSHWAILGWPNNTNYCVLNGSAKGLPMALRQDETYNRTLLQCSRYTALPPEKWPDPARILRAQCIVGGLENQHGTVHDLAFGHPATDLTDETIFCDSSQPDVLCCPLQTPASCWVVQTPELLALDNPWLNKYMFASLNDAIELCQATTRRIIVVGSGDPFLTGDTEPKVYNEQWSAIVPVQSAGANLTGPLLIQSGSGVTWRRSGNSLHTQCVNTTIEGFNFEHDGAVGVAIWQQRNDADGTDACNLHFIACDWNVTVDERAMYVEVDDQFSIHSSRYYATLATPRARRGVQLYGTECDERVSLKYSKFFDFSGFAYDVRNVSLYHVEHTLVSECGGKDVFTFTPYSTLVSVCKLPLFNTSAPGHAKDVVRFVGNKVRTTQSTSAVVGLMATCWLDQVPVNNKPHDIRSNDCKGLDFGIRFADMPMAMPSADPKVGLRALALMPNYNLRSKGDNGVGPHNMRFDLVRGPPELDLDLVTNPDSPLNRGRWCTDGCPGRMLAILIAVATAVGLLAIFLLLVALATGWCVAARFREPHIEVRQETLVVDPSNYGNAYATPFDNTDSAAPIASAIAAAATAPHEINNISLRARRKRTAVPGDEAQPLLAVAHHTDSDDNTAGPYAIVQQINLWPR